MTTTDAPIYYTSTVTEALYRRTGAIHEVFTKDGWKPTDAIIAHMVGEDNHMSEITEVQARGIAPSAFS